MFTDSVGYKFVKAILRTDYVCFQCSEVSAQETSMTGSDLSSGSWNNVDASSLTSLVIAVDQNLYPRPHHVISPLGLV